MLLLFSWWVWIIILSMIVTIILLIMKTIIDYPGLVSHKSEPIKEDGSVRIDMEKEMKSFRDMEKWERLQKRRSTIDKSIQCDSVRVETSYLSSTHSQSQDFPHIETSCAGCSLRNLKSVSQSRNNSYFPPPLSDSGDSGVYEEGK